jgi:sugar lactone lactonase YvrE
VHINRLLFEIPCQNILGENVLWHEQEQALYWTDIQGKSLHKCAMTAEVIDILTADGIEPINAKAKDDYLQQVLQVFDLPFRLGSFAFTNHSDKLLAGFENGLAVYSFTTGHIDWLCQQEVEAEHLRHNDGKCDPSGRFWLGSMVENTDTRKLSIEEQAALYCFSFDKGEVHTMQALSGLHISNGLCFSHQGRVMYHTDSASHKVYQYSLSKKGQIESRKQFAKFDKNTFPDGACTDANDNVWIALWGAACVACFDDKGNELFRHPLPVTQGTCVSIGGPNMNWLFVTSASHNLNDEKRAKQARAGNLFVYEISDSIGVTEPHVTID